MDVWLLGAGGDGALGKGQAQEGDSVLRRDGDLLSVGRVGPGGEVTWIESIAESLLPEGALDDVDPSAPLSRPAAQEALRTAVRGVEIAATERGG